VNERAEVQGLGSGTNIFAAGEIMAGNVIGKGYLAGLGMTIGSVFGRIAGKEAARAAGR
jgi:tricarballylate dehydrogenase